MLNDMLFSVIVPTHNRLDMLKLAIDSIWSQTFTDYEIIVIDDGSTDATQDYLRSTGDRLRVCVQANHGPGSARNLGLKIARGRYVAFLDSDDALFPWSLATYASIIHRFESPAFIAGKPFCFDSEQSMNDVPVQEASCKAFADYFASGDEWRWWGVSSFVIRTDEIRAVEGFTEANINGEDADLALKLGKARGFVQIVSPFTFGYRKHGENATQDLQKTINGVYHNMTAEFAGRYPGGRARAVERWRILTRHVRPVSLECLRDGRVGDGLRLYRETLRWHLRIGRWRYLLAFPVYSAVASLGSKNRNKNVLTSFAD